MKVNSELKTLVITSKAGKYSFFIEIPDSQKAKEHGLMDRTQLDKKVGMLFVEDREKPARMWMKGTPVSLDMIFIKGDGTIHRIENNTEPYSERKIWSYGLVLAVLEVAAGVCSDLGICEGDKVDYYLFK